MGTLSSDKIEEKIFLWSKDIKISIKKYNDKWKIIKEGTYIDDNNSINKHFEAEYNEEEAQKYSKEIIRKIYAKKIKKDAIHCENLIVLTGAGCSLSAGGVTMQELWEVIIKDKITEQNSPSPKSNISEDETKNNKKNNIIDISKIDLPLNIKENKNIEELLSYLQARFELDNLHGDIIKNIKKLIAEKCRIKLLSNTAAHVQFINKLIKRKLNLPRTQIFTLNYDTLFEQAAQVINAIVIDGFSYFSPYIFNGRHFDLDIVFRENTRIKNEESFYPNVFHLYKLHGSIDWIYNNDDNVTQKTDYTSNDNPNIIYPRESKYKESFSQPFFELMSRFHSSLRRQNIFLLIIGYSFHDNHINTAIEEALNSNSSLEVMVVSKTIKTSNNTSLRDKLKRFAENSSRITLIAEEFNDFSNSLPEINWQTAEDYDQSIFNK